MIIEIEAPEGDPAGPLDELEVGGVDIEIEPQHERQRKSDQRSPQGNPARIAGNNPLVALRHQNKCGTHQRQESNERKQRPMVHGGVSSLNAGTDTTSPARRGRSSSQRRSGRGSRSGAGLPGGGGRG